MTETETILKMIETVDPADAAKLDEIDARFLCYLTGCTFISRDENIITCQKNGYTYKETLPLTASEYTRSRDALKRFRPGGWMFRVSRAGIFHGPEQEFAFNKWGPWQCIADTRHFTIGQYELVSEAATEELAELHAIIQAIEFERCTTNP
jgi:hypothetical protein